MPKPKRHVNLDFLAFVRTLPCIACGIKPEEGVDPHHITTVKAGGDDVALNVMPLCREHHVAWHQYGPNKMCSKFPSVRLWLEAAGRTDVLDRLDRVARK